MEQIVLDADLKYVLAALDMAQRGALLTALLDGEYGGEDKMVQNIFCYLLVLQEKYGNRRRKMRELSTKGVAQGLKKWCFQILMMKKKR